MSQQKRNYKAENKSIVSKFKGRGIESKKRQIEERKLDIELAKLDKELEGVKK
jgi:hypothetical protein